MTVASGRGDLTHDGLICAYKDIEKALGETFDYPAALHDDPLRVAQMLRDIAAGKMEEAERSPGS